MISEAAEGQLMREAGIEAGAYASGGNRYDSAMRFANSSTVPAAEAGLGWSLTNVGIADLSQAAGGHDALVAAPYFGITRTPVIGSDRGGLPAETIRYLQDSSDTLRNVMFVSSTGGFIFSQATVSQAVSAARGGGSGGGVG